MITDNFASAPQLLPVLTKSIDNVTDPQSDEIIPVMKCDTFSADGLTIFIENLNDFKKRRRCPKAEIKTVVINDHNASFALDTNIKNAIMQQSGYKKIIVPQDQAFKKSQAYQKSIIEIGAKKKTLAAIEELAASVRGE